MALEKQRGISVTTSVLQFEYDDIRWNLLDTPGHNDFSEDTYRTLMAADCGIMILDAARGVEPQTRKLFHVCRLRNTPVVTFINKMDRPARDAFALMSEVEEVLGVSTVPFTWPIGSGDLFQGVYDRINKLVIRFERSSEGQSKRAVMKVTGLDDPELDALLGEEAAQTLRDEVELLDGAGEEWDEERFLAGEITPVFFGSALNNFGVEPFLRSFKGLCPPPGEREATGDVTVRPGRRSIQRVRIQGAGQHGPVAQGPYRVRAHLLGEVRRRDARQPLPAWKRDPSQSCGAIFRARTRERGGGLCGRHRGPIRPRAVSNRRHPFDERPHELRRGPAVLSGALRAAAASRSAQTQAAPKRHPRAFRRRHGSALHGAGPREGSRVRRGGSPCNSKC